VGGRRNIALESVRAARQNPGMNKSRSLRFLLPGLAIALLAGCAMFEKNGQPEIVGTWTNAMGTVWMIRANGTFDVDLNQNNKRDAWGKYTIDSDTITLMRTGGIKPKGCNGKGVYRFKIDDNNLRFTLVSDACKLRKKNVLTDWHRKK
jgi:hypothetical protein